MESSRKSSDEAEYKANACAKWITRGKGGLYEKKNRDTYGRMYVTGDHGLWKSAFSFYKEADQRF